MRNRILPVLLLALAVLAAGLWFVSRDDEDRLGEHRAARPPVASAPAAGAQPAAGQAIAPAERLDKPQALEMVALAPEAEKPARVVASTEYERELARGLWVEGRVLLHAGMPAGERVRVVARGKDFKHGPDHAVEIAADGGFRVAFAERTRSGRLELESRYLYIEQPLKVTLPADAPVLLEAHVGGVLRGRVVPPPRAPGGTKALVGQLVRVHGWMHDGSRAGVNINRWEKLDASLAFAFTALPPEIPYTVSCDPLVYEPASADELFTTAGGETVVDLELQAGVSVAGRVLDASGAPVADAVVRARAEAQSSRQAAANASGAFQLQGISPGEITLTATSKGYDTLELELGRLEHGAVQADLELRLPKGSSISGRILLPDGSPAEGASIAAELEADWEGDFPMGDSVFEADASGAFTVTGLKPGPHRLSVRATLEEQVTERSKLLGLEREKTRRRTLRATLKDVPAGTDGLVVQLSSGEAIRGVVIDDLVAPLVSFRVAASTAELRGSETVYHSHSSGSFEDAHGAFELSGFEAGRYSLVIRAEGHFDSPRIEVEVPLSAELPPIRLQRTARVSGVVLSPKGEPVPGARVETTGGEDGASSFLGGEPFRKADVASVQGRFSSDDVGLGKIKLRACAEGYAPSEPLELELAPGASLEGLALRLRAGAKLTGLVLDAGGRGVPRREVQIYLKSSYDEDAYTRADEAGAFEQDGLQPGTYIVVALPTEAEIAAQGLSSSHSARAVLSIRAEVEVTEHGGHVVLASSAGPHVRLTGTITAGGEPTSAHVWFKPAGDGGSSLAETDGDGSYEVLVTAPGDYSVGIRLSGDTTVHRQLTVQGPTEQRFDVDVPVGALAGRVLDTGEPLGGIEVKLSQRKLGSQDHARASALSDDEGRYSVEQLPAGTWTVEAGGPGTETPLHARARIEGIVVASGQRVRDVDLHLGAAGIVAGRVLTADGEPAQGAIVLARRASGELVPGTSQRWVDDQGLFTVGGLEPGAYAFGAFEVQRALEIEVEVAAGKTSEVELRLAPATLVRVLVRDAAGAFAEAQVNCRRSDGVDFSSWRNWHLALEDPEGEQRIGPLPPGTYTLTPDAGGVTSEVKTVTLKGEPEILVEFVL